MSDYDALDGTIPDTEESLQQIRDHVEQARSMPMSSSVMVNKEELLGLVEDAMTMLPEEIRQARWLLKERDEFLGLLCGERERRNSKGGAFGGVGAVGFEHGFPLFGTGGSRVV